VEKEETLSYTLRKFTDRMAIIIGKDEQRKFIVFTYLLRRSNLVTTVTTAGSSTGEAGFDSLRDRDLSLHHLALIGSGAAPPSI
jgi:hypothetical protein